MTKKVTLVSPYGGDLVDPLAPSDERADLFSYASGLHSVQLTLREVCDLEMLAVGAFSPLRGFMNEGDFRGVLDDMRLRDGSIFPIPITLSTNDLTNIKVGRDVALRDPKNDLLAVMAVSEIFEWDRELHAQTVYGTPDTHHPLVAEMQNWGRFNLSGELRVLRLPEYHDFQDLRLTPKQTRETLESMGRENIVAFQTRNPLHRAHELMTRRAIESTDGTLLLQPVVGMTKEGDIDYFTRVRTYKVVNDLAYEKGRSLLSLLPLAMRMAGPREAVLHAIIRRNYGANHLIIGRDHASPGTDAAGKPFYPPFAAQQLAARLSDEVGVKIVPFQEFVYLPEERRCEETGKVPAGSKTISLSGAQIRKDLLGTGKELPAWLIRKEVADILSEAYPPRHRRGVCLWFTGLSGSGKSTTAEIVTTLLLEAGRQSSLLDGDVVRTHLSQGLGFSREDRDVNVNRIGFVASEIVRHGGVAVCAAVSPYRHSRDSVRLMFPKDHFVEIFVDTPLEVCEARDPKGMYARARRGEILNFTGIDDAYEPPRSPEITLDTVNRTALENARLVLDFLRSMELLPTDAERPRPNYAGAGDTNTSSAG